MKREVLNRKPQNTDYEAAETKVAPTKKPSTPSPDFSDPNMSRFAGFNARALDPAYPIGDMYAEKTYSPNVHPRMIYRMRLIGIQKTRIADIMLIRHATLERWLRDYPDAQEAWDQGGEHADASVARALFKRATGYKHKIEKVFYNARENEVTRVEMEEKFAPDTSAAIFWLSNRQGKHWKNSSTRELVGKDGETLQPPTIIINPIISLRPHIPTIDGDRLLIETKED